MDAICWRRVELDVEAFSYNLVKMENGEILLAVNSEIKGGALRSLMSAIGGIPSAITHKLFKKRNFDDYK
jgi:hypothetical protein